MRKSKFTPEQILQALRQAEGGTPVVEICRKLGVTETIHDRTALISSVRFAAGEVPACLYRRASATCRASIPRSSSRSAMVRATRSIRW